MKYAWELTDKSEYSVFTHHFSIDETHKWELTGQTLNASLEDVFSRYAQVQGVFHKNYQDWQQVVLNEDLFTKLSIKAPLEVNTLDTWLNYKIIQKFSDNADGLSEAQKLYFGGLEVRGAFYRSLARKSPNELDEPGAYVIGCKSTFFVDVNRKVSGGRVTAPQKVREGGYFYTLVYMYQVRDKRPIGQIVQRLIDDPGLDKYWLSIPEAYASQITPPLQDKEEFILSVYRHINRLVVKPANDAPVEARKKSQERVEKQLSASDITLYQTVLDVYESSKLDDELALSFWEAFTYLKRDESLTLLSDLVNQTSQPDMCKYFKLSNHQLTVRIESFTADLRQSVASLATALL
jgi:hypothetical protein